MCERITSRCVYSYTAHTRGYLCVHTKVRIDKIGPYLFVRNVKICGKQSMIDLRHDTRDVLVQQKN